jgi:hypothetical protein
MKRSTTAAVSLFALAACASAVRVVQIDPNAKGQGKKLEARDPRATRCPEAANRTWSAAETLACAAGLKDWDKTAVLAAGYYGSANREETCRFLAALAEHVRELNYRDTKWLLADRCSKPMDIPTSRLPDEPARFPIAPALACDPWADTCAVLSDEVVGTTSRYDDGVRALLVAGNHVEVWTDRGRYLRNASGAWKPAVMPEGAVTPVVAAGQVVAMKATPQGFTADTWNGSAWVQSGSLAGNYYSQKLPIALVDAKQAIHVLHDSGLVQGQSGAWTRADTPMGNGENASLAIDPDGTLVVASHQLIAWANGARITLYEHGGIRTLGFDPNGVIHFLGHDIVHGEKSDRIDLAWRRIDVDDRMSSVTIARGRTPKQCEAMDSERCPQGMQFDGQGVIADASNRVLALFAQHAMTDVRQCNTVRIDCTCPPGGLDCGMNPDCGGGERYVNKHQCWYGPESREVESRIRIARYDRGKVEIADLVSAESNATGGAVSIDPQGRIHVAYRRGDQVRYRVLGKR